MEITIISATHPRRYKTDMDTITLDVLFAHLPEPIAFTARRDDPEAHGRELYVRAMFGEYGAITELTAPPPTKAQQRYRLHNALTHAANIMAPLEDADKLGIISEREKTQLTAWQHYRVALSRLPQSEGWPIDVAWPEPPQ